MKPGICSTICIDFKKICFLAVAALVFVMLAACSEGDDPDRDPVKINGESSLMISNESKWDATVYFDGDYIGKVDKHSERVWNVPAGEHIIKMDNAERDSTDEFRRIMIFEKGVRRVLLVDEDDLGMYDI